ncbi:MAG: SDR family oxidoreductase [Deltaproteobacteria bacterium]|nr:SDR family oxidoreductase [Deltaproteobacteria bacterium]
MTDLAGRIVLITGGASGIGRAVGTVLAARGARVWLADKNGAAADGAAAELRGRGLDVAGVTLDVTDAGAFVRVVDELVAREGRIDLAFNNAGVAVGGEIRDTPLEVWRRVLEVNLMGVVHGVHAVYPHMLRQRSGRIVNTASMAGLIPFPGGAPYAVSKHGVVALSTALRAEAHHFGVRVSVVCPGFIATPIYDSAIYVNVDRAKVIDAIPVTPIPVERCAEIIVRGIERDRRIILVGASAWMGWWFWRAFPGAFLRIAERSLGTFRRARLSG